MKKIYIVLILVLSVITFKIQAQVRVAGAIEPNSLTDAGPTHSDIYGLGGFRSVQTEQERTEITSFRRKVGMLVYVVTPAPGKFYQLRNGITDLDWVPITLDASTTAGGSVIFSGTGNPAAVGNEPATSKPGDYFFATDTKTLYGPKSGTNWGTITPLSGNTILSGAVAPDPGLGDNGDFYINTDITSTPPAPRLYGPKTAGGWGLATGLTSGPQGLPGPQGGTILKGTGQPNDLTVGSDGDYYIDATGKDFYGPKTLGAWGTSTINLGNGAPGVGIDFKGSFSQTDWDAAFSTPALNLAYYNTDEKKSLIYNGTAWQTLAKDGLDGTGGGGTINALAPSTNTSPGLAGEIFGGSNSSVAEVLNAILYPAVAAGVSLNVTNGAVYEVGATGLFSLTWSVTKAAKTATITDITVDGQQFTTEVANQPATGKIEGTKSITPPNTVAGKKTYTMSVIAGKTITTTADIIFRYRRYWGTSATPQPTEADIKAALNGNSDLAAGNTNSLFTIPIPAGAPNAYVFFAYPDDTALLQGFKIGDTNNLGAFNQTKVTVNSKDYHVYTSQSAFGSVTPPVTYTTY